MENLVLVALALIAIVSAYSAIRVSHLHSKKMKVWLADKNTLFGSGFNYSEWTCDCHNPNCVNKVDEETAFVKYKKELDRIEKYIAFHAYNTVFYFCAAIMLLIFSAAVYIKLHTTWQILF